MAKDLTLEHHRDLARLAITGRLVKGVVVYGLEASDGSIDLIGIDLDLSS